MANVKCIVLPLVSIAALTTGFFAARPAAVYPPNTVILPIEVFPADGASVHAEPVYLGVSDPSGVDSLYVKIHAHGYHYSEQGETNGYDSKASFRINGGGWVPVNNATARVYGTAAKYEGVGGPFATIEASLPVDGTGAVVAGQNTIEFRFNGTEGFSSGYRVLALDLLRAGGSSAVDGTTFVEEDYSAWGPPVGYSDDASIDAGEALWSARERLIERPGGVTITGSCADCHARNARDLEYFNYSNRTIIARSRFHGLTEEEGKQIAAYVRTRDMEWPAGYDEDNCGGRPWDPPYQPGPSLKDKPIECWAAGAGIEGVLDNDAEMLPYLFPNGTKGEAAKAAVHPDSSMAVWAVPISLQFPDWNNWLPDISPVDIMPVSTYESAGEHWASYQQLTTNLSNPTTRQDWIDQTIASREGGPIASHLFRMGLGVHSFWPTGEFYDPNWEDDHILRQSLVQVQAVRQWEVNTSYKLEDLGREVFDYGASTYWPNDADYPGMYLGGEGRQDRYWLSDNASVYDVAPHKNQRPVYPFGDGSYPTPNQNVFFSHTWYQLQATLNGNVRWHRGLAAVDWNYVFPHIGSTYYNYGSVDCPALRYYQNHVVVAQSRNNRRDMIALGWQHRKTWNPHDANPNRLAFAPLGCLGDDELEADITTAWLRGWYEVMTSYGESEILRYETPAVGAWEAASYTPTPKVPTSDIHPYSDSFMSALTTYQSRGVPGTLIDSLAAWGQQMWPLGDWEQWIMEDPPPVEPVQQAIQLEPGWNLISSYVAPSDSAMVTIWQPLADHATVVRDALGHEFNPSQGTGTLEYWRRGEGYQVYMSEPAVLTLQGELVTPEATPLSLHEGWNQVAYLGTARASVAEAFSGILPDLVAVKKNDGAVFLPEYELDQIGLLSPGQGYKLLLADDAVLVYPPNAEGGRAVPARRVTPPQGGPLQGRPAGERQSDRVVAPQVRGAQ